LKFLQDFLKFLREFFFKVLEGLCCFPAEGGTATTENRSDAGAEHEGDNSCTSNPEPNHKVAGAVNLVGRFVAILNWLHAVAVQCTVLVLIELNIPNDTFVIVQADSILH